MSKLPKEMQKALLQCEYTLEEIKSFSILSRLVQDVGIWGDDFDDFYEALCEQYGASPFIHARYVPSEFAWMKEWRCWLPCVSVKKYIPCEPLSLGELDDMMRN